MDNEHTIGDEVIRQFLSEKLDLIKREYAPRHFIVFGSRAEGLAREESDIDIILVSDRFREIRFVNRMGHFLNTVHPHVHVDAICYTPEEFEIMMHHPSSFVRNAVAHGIHVE